MVMAKPEEIVEEEVEAEDLEEAEMVGTMVEDLSANYGKIGHIVWQCYHKFDPQFKNPNQIATRQPPPPPSSFHHP